MTPDHKISLLNNKKFSFEFKEGVISDIFGKMIECDDESGSEATFRLAIEDFSKSEKMKEGKVSPRNSSSIQFSIWQVFLTAE